MTTPPEPAASDALGRTVRAGLERAGLPDDVSAYVLALDRMAFGAWNPDDDIYPASVIKVAIMAEAFARRDAGDLAFDDRIAIDAGNLTTTAEPTPLDAGRSASIAELVALMIERSDNIATNQLIDLLRRERVTASMRSLGLRDFLLGRKLSGSEPLVDDPEMAGTNRLSAHDIARLLLLIATDAVPAAREQRAMLRGCVHNDKLAPGLRAGDSFMHKTGETSSVSHDAGILRTAEGREYVVVLYTRGDESINPRMTAWMRAVRDAL